MSSTYDRPRRSCCSKRSFSEASSIADLNWHLHDLSVEIQRKPFSSLLWALGNLALATIAFLALYTVRFSGLGIWSIKFVFFGLLVTVVLAIRDLWRSNTRWQGFIAFLLCLPVLMFFGLLTVWEGPLYVAASGSSTLDFQVDGAAGFHGIQIYGPEHSKAEWRGDDIGLIWSFDWQRPHKFPPMQLQFAYGTLPTGYSQKAPLLGAAPALDPNVTYTVVVQPAMGMPEYFTLHGRSLTKAEDEYVTSVCWGPLSVPGRSDPAYVRVNCETKKTLAMSERGQARLKAYQEKRISYY
jgi:hypothetical protein